MVIIERSVVVKESKLTNQLLSAIPIRYKQNAGIADLHSAHNISSNFKLAARRFEILEGFHSIYF